MNLREARRAIVPIATGFVMAVLWTAFSPAHAAMSIPEPHPDGSMIYYHPVIQLTHVTPADPVYTVRAGESMSEIALRQCHGVVRDWTGIYHASRVKGLTGRNANAINTGQRLAISCTYDAAELRYAPPVVHYVPPPVVVTDTYSARPAGNSYSYAVPVQQYHSTAATYSGAGGCQSHIIADESGGNARAVNPTSGAGGLYQFLPSTWHALGHSGLPEDASVAEQTQAYYQQVALSGYAAWAASGGC